MTHRETHEAWALLRSSDNQLDGARSWFDGEANGTTRTRLFPTRDAARRYRDEHLAYIRTRPDLRQEPHGWRPAAVVRVRVTVETV